MINDFESEQSLAIKAFKNACYQNHFSHAYLIDTNGYSKSLDLAIAIAKFILCPTHHQTAEVASNCEICKRIDNRSLYELYIIDIDGLTIKKEEISKLQDLFKTKPINGEKRIYIINNCEKMNESSSNSILKFLEEPEAGITAILLTANTYSLNQTIVSRCQTIKLQPDLLDVSNTENEEEAKKFILELEKLRYHLIAEKPQYLLSKDKQNIMCKINTIALLYRKCLDNTNCDELTIEIRKNNTISDIIRKIKVTLETKEALKSNANVDLLIDKYIIEISGGIK